MPEFFIRESTGKAPADFFSEPYGFSGAHDRTAKLVESGQVQAGALSYKTYDKLVEKGEIDPAKAQVIWKTPPYADYNFTVHPSVEETYGQRLVGVETHGCCLIMAVHDVGAAQGSGGVVEDQGPLSQWRLGAARRMRTEAQEPEETLGALGKGCLGRHGLYGLDQEGQSGTVARGSQLHRPRIGRLPE